MREVRKRNQSGRQTSILCTDYRSDLESMSAGMFSRWSQENFFRYMRMHFGLDQLAVYSLEEIPDTVKVINPTYRELDGQVRKTVAKLSRKLAEFGALSLKGDIEPQNVECFELKKAALKEKVDHLQVEAERLKLKRKDADRHISMSQLPDDKRFMRLATQSKHLIDTIKMIAYRAETAMAHVLREQTSKPDQVRTLLREIYSTEANLIPDDANKTLTVRLHHLANHSSDIALIHLCSELNATETKFPGTDLRLVYQLVSSENP